MYKTALAAKCTVTSLLPLIAATAYIRDCNCADLRLLISNTHYPPHIWNLWGGGLEVRFLTMLTLFEGWLVFLMLIYIKGLYIVLWRMIFFVFTYSLLRCFQGRFNLQISFCLNQKFFKACKLFSFLICYHIFQFFCTYIHSKSISNDTSFLYLKIYHYYRL